MRVEAKLKEMGLALPAPMRVPEGFHVKWRQVRVTGNRAIIAGHGPRLEDGMFAGPRGKVGSDLTLEQGYAAARYTALGVLGDLMDIAVVVCHLCAQASFAPGVINHRPTAKDKVNLGEKLSQFTEHWSPRVVGELNGQDVKLAKLRGDFVWHHHEDADELFLVLNGRLLIQLRDRDITLDPGEFFIVPRGVEHKPVAEVEAHVLLFEPAGTLNTGNVTSERTVRRPERI